MRSRSLVFLLPGLLAATTAWSAPRIPAVGAPAVVREGAEYETVVAGLPAGIEEFELFLLVEDGPGRLVRLTAEREGGGGAVRWRMPRVGADRARLVLRAGGRFGETESEPSAAFAIEAGEPLGQAELLRAKDELERHFGRDAAPGPRILPPGAPALVAAARTVLAVASPRDAGARPPARALSAGGSAAPAPAPAPALRPLPRRPAFVPLRN